MELLAPAGDLNRGQIALDFGADAIYFGGKQYSLRARASNFDNQQLHEMINYAHQNQKKVYLVTNIVCHNHLLNGFEDFLHEVMKTPPDAFLVTDPSIYRKIQKHYPNAIIHVSTQQSVTNSKAALFWARNGAKRIVTAREVSLNEIKLMINNVHDQIEIEMFGHGAVCISYSGRCMLSSNFCLRDANNGGCAQSCRWVNELYKDNRSLSKTFSMSAKDMCLINYVKDIIDCRVSALKIEGRMKSEHYIATVVNAYRKIIDSIYDKKQSLSEYVDDVLKAANREVSYAWFNGNPSKDEMLYHEIPKQVNQLFAFIIDQKIDDETYRVTSRNYFRIINDFQVLGRNLKHIENVKLLEIKDKDGLLIDVVNKPMSKLIVKFDKPLDLSKNDMARISNIH
ncbi:MAG: U32 family peptidase [Mycoplasmataceae bacterium]|nr:U32 family peptidase [Mycoplasmataceae bacterium]